MGGRGGYARRRSGVIGPLFTPRPRCSPAQRPRARCRLILPHRTIRCDAKDHAHPRKRLNQNTFSKRGVQVERDGGDRVRDLVQQGPDLGGVVFVAVGQGGGHDPAGLGVHAEMELPPRPVPLGAVLLDQPLARAVELQPRAVDQQVHGAGIAAGAALRTVAARLRPRPLQRLGPAAQGGVVPHGEGEPEQADDGADQPFGLPVRQPEHGLERQRRQDRQVGIRGLPAPARAPLGLPRLDRLVRKPDRQAATPAQALVVIAPVRDLALLPRDVVASVLVQLEGQGGHPGSDGGLPCYLDRAPGATRGIPATTWRVLYEDVYCRRGAAENHIKAWKTHLAADRTSCPKATANQFRLFLHAGAYWLMWSLRALMPKRSLWRVAQFDTLRLRLIKIAARVVELKTMIRLHLPTACPDQAILRVVLGRIPHLVT